MNESRQHEAWTVPIASVTPVVASAASRVSARRLCDDAGLDYSLLGRPGARIPICRLTAVYESAARLTGDRAFGLRVGEALDVRHFGLFGYILLHSATLGLALERAARYLPLWTEGAHLRCEHDGAWVCVSWEYADPNALPACQDSEMSISTVVATCRRVTEGGAIGLAEAWFRHEAPRDRSRHDRVFGSKLHFNKPSTTLVFRRDALDIRLSAADERLCAWLMRCADADMDGMRVGCRGAEGLVPGALDPPTRAREWLRAHLEEGQPRLNRLALELGLSVRSLQRELGARGTTYAKVLSAVRREIAEDCLRDPKVPLAEISWRLGYGQPNEFHRAFREWTGVTPARFRERLATGRDGP
jgi:AraC-like DNA-binding protein